MRGGFYKEYSEEDVYYSAPKSFFSDHFFYSLSDFPVTGL